MSGPRGNPDPASTTTPSWASGLFAGAAFLGAFLLFWLELLFARMLLPEFGGAAAVWTTSLLFFQVALLLGYLYAHGLIRRLSPRAGLGLHAALLAAGAACLPVTVGASPFGLLDSPVASLLLVLTASLGLPFLAVSATAPLLQAWFAQLHGAAEPTAYRLYAASNAGSLLALLAYPLGLERHLDTSAQSVSWALGYGLLALALGACGLLFWRRPAAKRERAAQPPGTRLRLRWFLRSFAGAALLYGVTTTLTTDLTATPLLWVVPLALYLASFVLAFHARRLLRREALGILLAPLLVLMAATALIGLWQFPGALALMGLHLLGAFLGMLFLHRDLYDERPASAHLTSFYVWIALGGVAAGAFCVLGAPRFMSSVWEYPVALLLTAFLLHGSQPTRERFLLVWATKDRTLRWMTRTLSLGIGMLTALLLAGWDGRGFADHLPGYLLLAPLALALARGCDWGKLRALHLVGLGVLAGQCAIVGQAKLVHRDRSFFGVHSVLELNGFRHYVSGSTVHGRQSLDPARAREPAAYYARSAPMGQAFAGLPPGPRRVAVLGLGIGGLAAHGREDETWRFYEIDPVMLTLARDPSLFTYLRDLPSSFDVVLADGRLALAAEARRGEPRWDVLVMDAFSSDAIPTHLLTVEAFAVYLERLAPDGQLVINISNRSLDLEPQVAALAARSGLVGQARKLTELSAAQRLKEGASRSHCVVLTRAARALRSGWHRLPQEGLPRPWTDERLDLLSALKVQ